MKKYALPIVVSILVVAGIVWLVMVPEKPGKLDTFAACLGEKGAVFYGAFWCPHCQNQKAIFGRSAKLLPYVECSTADGKGQLPICKDKGVTTYPTWDFATTERLTGEIPLKVLAEKTSCVLPE
jgi:thiol-disulfide isomerase/thioredoxin